MKRTLLLLCIVLSVIACVVAWWAFAVPTYISQRGPDAGAMMARRRMALLAYRIDQYRQSHGEMPSSLNDIGMADYRDPWGKPFRYRPDARSYLLSSDGPDQVPSTTDDVRRDPAVDADLDADVRARDGLP